MPGGNAERSNKEWLLNGDIDKPVYIITQTTKKKLLEGHTDCTFLKQEGGFLFYYRSVKTVNK
jgi:hypothetical protein